MGETLAGEEPGTFTVRGKILAVGTNADVESKGTVTAPTVNVNGVAMTASVPNNTLSINAALNTFHDFSFTNATELAHNGTFTSSAGTVAGVPRVVLAKGQRVKFAREVPAGWSQVSVNFLWTKEAASTGNAHWSITYIVRNFLSGVAFDSAPTTVDLGGIAVPANPAQTSKYTISTGVQAVSTPAQLFGIPPLLIATLTRVDDATDTVTTGDVSVVAMNTSRTST